MPTYDYECKQCDETFEVFQSITAPKLTDCPTCGGPVTRLIGTGSGIVFKGSGFYETDFKEKKGSKPEPKKKEKESKKEGSKKEAAKSESTGKEKPKSSEKSSQKE